MQHTRVHLTSWLGLGARGNVTTRLKSSRILQHVPTKKRCFSTANNLVTDKGSKPPRIWCAGDLQRSNELPALLRSSSPICARTYSQEAAERPHAQSTIDEEEAEKFRELSDTWWDECGEFQALHTLNDLRVPLIRDAAMLSRRDGGQKGASSPQIAAPLQGHLILDVGCGGGILTEPLARLGATVTGVDMVEENISMARKHASHDPAIRGHLKYIHGTAEDLVGTESGTFDVVVASEVLEHVSDVEQVVSTCVDLAKPGGSVIFTTINKTMASYVLAIVGAEDILRVVPHGTHNWEKFIPPENLQELLEHYGCDVKLVNGMMYNPLTHRWSWTDILACNYAIHAIKSGEPTPTERQNVEPQEEEIELKESSHER